MLHKLCTSTHKHLNNMQTSVEVRSLLLSAMVRVYRMAIASLDSIGGFVCMFNWKNSGFY